MSVVWTPQWQLVVLLHFKPQEPWDRKMFLGRNYFLKYILLKAFRLKVDSTINEKSNVLSGCICVHSTKVHEYALIVSNARDFKPQERHGLDRIITQLSRVPVKYAAASRSMSPLDHGTLFIKFKLWGNTMSYPSVNRNLQNPFSSQKKNNHGT